MREGEEVTVNGIVRVSSGSALCRNCRSCRCRCRCRNGGRSVISQDRHSKHRSTVESLEVARTRHSQLEPAKDMLLVYVVKDMFNVVAT